MTTLSELQTQVRSFYMTLLREVQGGKTEAKEAGSQLKGMSASLYRTAEMADREGCRVRRELAAETLRASKLLLASG